MYKLIKNKQKKRGGKNPLFFGVFSRENGGENVRISWDKIGAFSVRFWTILRSFKQQKIPRRKPGGG